MNHFLLANLTILVNVLISDLMTLDQSLFELGPWLLVSILVSPPTNQDQDLTISYLKFQLSLIEQII